jgi:hypothetical protein
MGERSGATKCLGKTRYSSREDAETVAKELSKSSDKRVKGYHCGMCDGWHLTSRGK